MQLLDVALCATLCHTCVRAPARARWSARSDEMTEHEMAAAIKRELAAAHPADMWQVFVGRSFSCYVTHEEAKYIYFYIGQTGFCVYAA